MGIGSGKVDDPASAFGALLPESLRERTKNPEVTIDKFMKIYKVEGHAMKEI